MKINTVQEIERAVSKLSPEELSLFRVWFAQFDADAWDREFEEDVATVKLDALADKALRNR